MSTPPTIGEVTDAPSGNEEIAPQANGTFIQNGLGDLATRACFLALFIIVGFVGNCVLVATIAQSRRLKGFMLNLFIISAAVFNLINCIVNMPLILGNTITETWDYGDFLCRFNAFSIQLASIGTILGLMLMMMDRFLAIRCKSWYGTKFTPLKSNILIVYTWLHAFGLSVPLIFGSIPVKAFRARYLCAVDNGAPIVYLAIRALCGYFIPAIVMLGILIYIIKITVQEKVLKGEKRNSASDEATRTRTLMELSAANYVIVLVVMWCICECPYLILTSLEQFKNSAELQDSASGLTYTYPWELELSFTWLKLSYAIVLPVVTFFWRKDVWQKFKNCVLCRKSNLIDDASPVRQRKLYQENDMVNSQVDKTSGSIPVLFATPEGLHFQTFANAKEEEESSAKIDRVAETLQIEINHKTRKCDVFGSQQILDHEEADTSDYDSEIDPFSGSNPISVHTKSSICEQDIESGKNEDGKDTTNEIQTNVEVGMDGMIGTEMHILPNKNNFDNDYQDGLTVTPVAEENSVKDDKCHDQDSGRGSYGENSLKKKGKRKKRSKQQLQQAENFDTLTNNDDNHVDIAIKIDNDHSNLEENVIEKNIDAEEKPNSTKSRPHKKRKKRQQNKGDPPLTGDRSLPALRRPAPARLGPLHGSEDMESDSYSSEQYKIEVNENTHKETKITKEFKSEHPLVPIPAPRKSLIKTDT